MIIDKKMQEEIYRRYHNYIYTIVYKKINNQEYSQDIVHETFITSFEKIETLRDKRKIKSWMVSIALNICNKFLNNKNYFFSSNEIIFDKTIENSFEDTILNGIEFSFIKNELNFILNKLDKKYLDVISLRFYKNYSYLEISKILNLNINTVRTRLNRGKKIMLGEIKQNKYLFKKIKNFI